MLYKHLTNAFGITNINTYFNFLLIEQLELEQEISGLIANSTGTLEKSKSGKCTT